MRVKFFSTTAAKTRTTRAPLGPELEREINAWLEARPDIQVVRVEQSAGGGSWWPASVLVSVWYEEKGQS